MPEASIRPPHQAPPQPGPAGDKGLLDTLVELSAQPCWIRDAGDGRLLAVNEPALQAYRCGRAQFAQTVDAVDAQAWSRPLAPAPLACAHRRADGTELKVLLSVREVDGEGLRLRVYSVQDAALHERTHQALLLAQRAIDASASGIAIVDARQPDQPLLYVNPAFERMTGYAREEVLGRNCRFLQDQDRNQESLPTLREAIARGEPVTVVLRNYRKDGSLFWNELSLSPVHGDGGTVTHFIGIQNDVSGPRRFEAELRRRATHDPLTGLPDHRVFVERAAQALRLAHRRGRGVGVLAVSLRGLVEWRRVAGHAALDELLRDAAGRLATCLRHGDTLSRVGGDEFSMLLPDQVDQAAVRGRAEEVVAALAHPFPVPSGERPGGCRVGASFVAPDGDGDPLPLANELVQRAGVALAEAEADGICVFSDELGLAVSRRQAMRQALEQALARGEFRLRYQPQMELGSGRIVGAEALIRWMHPERGEVQPAEFIHIAEESGLIQAIGDWVLDEACRQHRAWVAAGLMDGAVAVNISGHQLQREGFVERVRQSLAQSGLAAERLELELTESVLMDSSCERTIATLQALRGLGVRLSIDDFGTGYSSLGYLRRLPVHAVKIDRSFIRDIETDAANASITLSVVSLAHHLRLQVIAEGVETDGQLSYLRRNLCDVAQGFAIAMPMWPDELERFVSAFRSPVASDSERPTLLLVDDDRNVLRALVRTLRREGYRLLSAGSAAEALELLALNDVQVILSDQRMPEMQGTEFLSRVKVLYPQTVRMVLSGYTDLATVTDAVNRGAVYRFLTKPWEDGQLQAHLKDAFRHAAALRRRSAEA